jgi:uncharacterized protein YjiS (DUF1127 family)
MRRTLPGTVHNATPHRQEPTMSVERTANPLRTSARPALRVATDAMSPLMRLWVVAVEAVERRRAAKLIGEMDDRMLRDIGIHRGNAAKAIREGREDQRRVMPWWER